MQANQLSGVLTIQNKRFKRQLYVLSGSPIAFESSHPADKLSTILDESADWRRHAKGYSGATKDIHALELLAAKDELPSQAAQAATQAWLTHAVRAPLDWTDGSWQFHRSETLSRDRIDPALLPSVNVIDVLVDSLDALTDGPEALLELLSLEQALVQGPHFGEIINQINIPKELAQAISKGGKLDSAFAKDDLRAAKQAQRVWLLMKLEAVRLKSSSSDSAFGLALERGPPETTRSSGSPESASASPRPQTKQRQSAARQRIRSSRGKSSGAKGPPVELIEEMLRGDRDSRTGRELYKFLGIGENESDERVAQAIQRLRRRWTQAKADSRLDREHRVLASKLLKSLTEVERDIKEHRANATMKAANTRYNPTGDK